jgi:hypothetical protein
MSKDWVFKRHIRIPENQVSKLPKKSKKPPHKEGEQKEPKDFGQKLADQIERVAEYCRRPGKLVDEDYLAVVRTTNKIVFEDKVLDRLGLKLSLQTDDFSAIVSASPEVLENLRKMVKKYTETAELRSSLNELDSISPADFTRYTPEVAEWVDHSTSSQFVEIEFLPNLGEEKYWSILNSLLAFLKNQGYESVESRVREHSASLRANVAPQTVKAIASGVDAVWQARSAPRIVTGKPQSMEFKGEVSPEMPELNAKTICVLDTGVDLKHPLLKDAIVASVDLTSDGNEEDSDGHGTFVSGLAAFGELENRTGFAASAKIISVKVLGNEPVYRPYLETRIEEAVKRFHETTRIFSMSVMYPETCSFSQPSELAFTIDKLSREYGVLFILSTGNLDREPEKLSSLPYPMYFGHKDCTVYDGAEASSCITVGGVANKESGKSLAQIKQPSPFTRRGDLVGRGKPDVVSWAGNAERVPTTGALVSNDRLGVVSFGLSSKTIFAYDFGTSCAAPVVANFVARLQVEYPEATPNLLKALLVHFAHLPEERLRLNVGDSLKNALYGKGLPDFYKAAYSTKSCATFILEDSLAFNEVAWIPFYVPKVMKQIYGEKIMRVTLVYDPPVDRGVLGYAMVDLDFKLYKVSNPSDKPKIQRNWENIYRRPWDSVKTDTFRWQKTGWGQEWYIMIYPRLRFKAKVSDLGDAGQKYSLVITLEDPKNKIDIYNAITNERKKIAQTLQAYLQSAKRKS